MPAVAATVKRYLALGHEPELSVFRTRLGIVIIDLAGDVHHPNAAQAAARLLDEATATVDGYVARDILAHTGCRTRLTDTQERILSAALETSGLDHGGIPTPRMTDLRSAIAQSEAVTATTLDIPIVAPTP